MGNESIILKFMLLIVEIEVTLIHEKNHLGIAEIKLQDFSFLYQQKINEFSIDTTLKDLKIIDLTNYPNTICFEDEWEKVLKI